MEDDTEIIEIKKKLLSFFKKEEIVESFKKEKDGMYSAILNGKKIIFQGIKNFKQQDKFSIQVIRFHFMNEGDNKHIHLLKKYESDIDESFSILKEQKINTGTEEKEKEYFLVNFKNNIFFIDENGIRYNNKKGKIINDYIVINELKKAIEESLIKTESLLSGKNMIVNSEVLELYTILLKQINNIDISKHHLEYCENNDKFKEYLELNDEIKKLDPTCSIFSVDQFFVNLELSDKYKSKYFTVLDFFKLTNFKKNKKIGQKFLDYLKEYDPNLIGKKPVEILKETREQRVVSIIRKLKEENNSRKSEFLSFWQDVKYQCGLKITRDGENNTIKHAANIVFSDDGKRYLIDSSLADYEYLFVKDLALNEESKKRIQCQSIRYTKNSSWL